jgi:hypothetical protein
MVQTTDHYQFWDTRRWETEESLKKYLAANYQTIKTLAFSLGQTSTAAFVEVLEDSSETVEFPATGLTGHLPREFRCTSGLVADEVLLGLNDKSKVYGVIKVACAQMAQSRYQVPAGRRAFLVAIDALGPHTNPSTYQVTCTPKGYTSAIVWNKGNIVSGAWDHQDFFWELAEGSEITFEIKKDADANHGTFILRYKIIEAS